MKVVSIVIPCYNESQSIAYGFERLQSVLDSLNQAYVFKIVCVNDGSTDNTVSAVQACAKNYPYTIKVVDLFRNFGASMAISAGLHHANGDAVWVLDADMQNPPEILPDFLQQWKQGCDIVYGKRITREKRSLLRKVLTHTYYKMFNRLSEVHIPKGTSEFVLLDKKMVQTYCGFREQDMFTKGLYAWMGGVAGFVEYTPEDRKYGTSSFSAYRLFKLAFQGVFGFSVVPLRLISLVGFIVSIVSFLYILVRLVHYLIYGNAVAGYESTLVIILFIGGIQMLCMGMLGEYIGRIYSETKRRPQFIVRNIYTYDAKK